ncbi:MAG TPA: hypothetical protein P5102_14975 [Candidatus Competibacteraceae bacterium]|nr:hypothetical protein [Candidatus Competibacteraceae bacterium]
MPVKVHLYRYRNPDGTAKDWATPVAGSPLGLTVYYGRTGSALRQAQTPVGQCPHGNPVREGERRIREKLAKGYQSLGQFWLADNRRDLTPVAGVPALAGPASTRAGADAAESAPCLYWRWRAGSEGSVSLDAACAEVLTRLAAVGWPASAPWSIDPGGALRANGVVPLTDGQQPLVAFWLLLAQRLPGLTLVGDHQQTVTRWPAALPVDAAILETLGLQPKTLDQLLAATGGEDWFFG